MENNQKTLGMLPLVLFSVGCTLASGVFALSGDFAYAGAYTLGTLIGWGITFVGMLGLVGCFLRLTTVKPELTSGIYSYARAGFGEYIGFNSAWGYWLSAILAYVTFSTGFLGSLSELLPFLGDGMNVASLIIGSVILWLLVLLLLNGVNQAVIINAVAVIFKAIPIVFLVIAAIFAGAFSFDTFMDGGEIRKKTSGLFWYGFCNGFKGDSLDSRRLQRRADGSDIQSFGHKSIADLLLARG